MTGFKESQFFLPEDQRSNFAEAFRYKEQLINLSKRLRMAYESGVEIRRGKSGFIWQGDSPVSAKEGICVKSIHDPSTSINTLREEFDILSKAYQSDVSVSRPFAYLEYDDGIAMLIMQSIKGLSGREMLEAHMKWSPEEFAAYRTALRSEIDKLHNARIYHRDLHLGNVMFGEDGKVSLIDFGDAVSSVISSDENEIYLQQHVKNGKYISTRYPRDEQILQELRALVEVKPAI